MRVLVVTLVGMVATLAMSACERVLPTKPKECNEQGVGCLSDEVCVELRCVARPKCELDEDCGSPAEECVLPAQVCALRPGFGKECSAAAPCEPGFFCALGLCQESTVPPAIPCAERSDCPTGQKCSRSHFFCISDGPCTLADVFPELACDPGEVCDSLSERCVLPCQNECTPNSDDCGAGLLCDGSCQCVQCINDDNCGAGLICNRAGNCVSENICFSDQDCEPPLICDPRTAICQVAPPACFDDFDCAIAEICNIATGRCELPDGPCVEDGLEDHDTPAQAEERDIAPGGSELVERLQLCPNDDDVFSVALLAGDRLIAEIQNALPGARATIWLLDSSGETSLDFEEAPPLGSGRVQHTAQVDETIYIRLTAFVAATPYQLLMERVSGQICTPDFFEGGSGNNNLANATPPDLTPVGIELAAEICPGDEDFYQVNVAPGEAIRATLEFDGASTDLDIALLDEFGAVVAQSAGSGQPEVTRRRFAAGGTIYVRVRGFGNNSGPYNLTIERDPPFVCANDAGEPNNTVATAPVLALNDEITAEPRTICSGDVDLLLAPLEDFERLVIITAYDDADVELRIEVLDETGSNVLETSPFSTGGAALSYDAQGNETVLLRISGVGGTIGAYTLSVLKENQLECEADASEPNNTVATASPLPADDELLSICESDQDLFIIEGEAGRKLVVDASFRQADGDIDLMLFGLDGQQVLAVADDTSDGEHLEAILPLTTSDEAGHYTLRVFSLTSGARSRYLLNVDVVSP